MKHTEPRLIHTEKYAYWKMPDGTIRPHVSGGSEGQGQVPLTPAEQELMAQQRGEVLPPAPLGSQETITIPVDPPKEAVPGERMFTAADVERIRKEEKDKLYGRLSELDTTVKSLREKEDEREQQRAAAIEAAEAEARQKAEEEMNVRELLQTKEQEWDAKFTSLAAQQDEERRMFAMERQFQEVEQYRQQALSQNADEIMPELADLVRGNTPQEIDASIDFVREKTSAILGQMQVAAQQQRQGQRGPSVTAPPMGPMENETNHQTLTADDIRNMDMETYRQNRDRILGSLNSRTQDRGLYG